MNESGVTVMGLAEGTSQVEVPSPTRAAPSAVVPSTIMRCADLAERDLLHAGRGTVTNEDEIAGLVIGRCELDTGDVNDIACVAYLPRAETGRERLAVSLGATTYWFGPSRIGSWSPSSL